eukprot:6525763-Pyramimonas_sp.AAC.1
MTGLPWQPDPNSSEFDLKVRVIMPILRQPRGDGGSDAEPIWARGVAVGGAECLAMGPRPDGVSIKP